MNEQGRQGMGRSVSPDTTRNLWMTVKNLTESGQTATLEAIAERIGHMYDWNMEQINNKIYLAADARLLAHTAGPDDVSVYSIPSNLHQGATKNQQDWYCFECHGAGSVIGCATCYRVYHAACLNMTDLEGAEFSCPVCVSCEKPTMLERELMKTQLESILMWILKQGGACLGEPQIGSNLQSEQYQTLIAYDIDLAAMRTKLNTQRYPTPRHFFADFQTLVHNVFILHGKDGPLTQTVSDFLKQIKSEIDNMELSVNEDEEPYIDAVGDASSETLPQRRRTGTGRSGSVGSPSSKRVRREVLANDDIQTGWAIDERFKKMLMDLQRHWLVEYQQSREKLLVDLTEKLHQEFLSDQQKIRTELLTQFKDELDATRQELEQKYRDTLKQELDKLGKKHKTEISNTKKKQWCWQCESEAIYHCCWNTAYCSVECQQAHWPTHRKYCRRKKQQNQSSN